MTISAQRADKNRVNWEKKEKRFKKKEAVDVRDAKDRRLKYADLNVQRQSKLEIIKQERLLQDNEAHDSYSVHLKDVDKRQQERKERERVLSLQNFKQFNDHRGSASPRVTVFTKERAQQNRTASGTPRVNNLMVDDTLR